MKKYLITFGLMASVLVPSASYAELQAPEVRPADYQPLKQYQASSIPAGSSIVCPSNDPAVSCPTTLPTSAQQTTFSCVSFNKNFNRNMNFGSRNLKNDTQVTLLQELLRTYGYLKVGSTGYFGGLTLQAVKDYQRAQGLPPTGFVGVLTRARLNMPHCSSPDLPLLSVTITSPKGGEAWATGSTQTISWTDNRTYIQAPKYDVKIQVDLDCKAGQPCIALFPIPLTIAKNVSGNSYSWKVGDYVAPNDTPNAQFAPVAIQGKYRVLVCPTGLTNEDINGCAKSASYVTINPASTSANLNIVSPKAGDVFPTGTTQKITWTDSNIYIQAQKYDITLSPKSPCNVGKPCPFLMIKPYTLASGVMLSTDGYSWTVGSTTEAGRTIPAGDYTISICSTGNSDNCAQSGIFSITAGTTTTPIATSTMSSLTPNVGPIGTKVRIYTTFGPDINHLNFGTGYIPKSALTTGNGYVEFNVPNQIAPACYYAEPVHCLIAAVVTPPAMYAVSFTLNNGNNSNKLPFTVTAQQ